MKNNFAVPCTGTIKTLESLRVHLFTNIKPHQPPPQWCEFHLLPVGGANLGNISITLALCQTEQMTCGWRTCFVSQDKMHE